jgi:hypothetical protein
MVICQSLDTKKSFQTISVRFSVFQVAFKKDFELFFSFSKEVCGIDFQKVWMYFVRVFSR